MPDAHPPNTSPEERVLARLYRAHLAEALDAIGNALVAGEFDALVVHSGTPLVYFSDDQSAPFRTNPYFAHLVPLPGPQHLLLVAPGARPRLFRVTPEDIWHERLPEEHPFWANEFDIVETGGADDAWKALTAALEKVSPKKRAAYVGDGSASARARGFSESSVNPSRLIARLDWRRGFKTPYEIECIAEANHRAAHAHEAARDAFFDGACELEMHEAYLEELGQTERELPYGAITALDEKTAILHYEGKRLVEDGRTALIDAGASYLGYASDITRTYAADFSDFLFRGLLGGVETIERELVAMAKPGAAFPELHRAAHEKIGDLLHEFGIVKLSGAKAAELGLTRVFFPHGLGHFLGLTVHDVGGAQAGPQGGSEPAPPEFPNLRMTRTIRAGMVFTIEPGLYFIESLLAPHRAGKTSRYFDWALIDRLSRSGGIRIEDDILATEEGNRNLTREFLP